MKILVLGATGMLGHAVMQILSEDPELEVSGTVRAQSGKRFFPANIADRLVTGVDVENQDSLTEVLAMSRPDVVVNCIGLVKQLAQAYDPLQALPINALLPHRLAKLCSLGNARLIQISTDCVFSGKTGNYVESDFPDAGDLYGRSKLLGEVEYENSITLRTSIIGHELQSPHSLIDWFLAQEGTCRGYTSAIFSGLPTIVLAKIIRDVVIPRPELFGLYHVSADPISKFDLLQLVAKKYGKDIQIVPDDSLKIDRSLDSARFKAVTGYKPPQWEELVNSMFAYR